jgi:predicted DNA binding CopG/RHH family protein
MTKTLPIDPFSVPLDAEELEIEQALERGEYEEYSNLSEIKEMFEAAAAKYKQLHSSKPITIRVKQLDLIKIKAKAAQKDIAYQSLLGQLFHQYAEGEISLKL